jgi:hypothetical protein
VHWLCIYYMRFFGFFTFLIHLSRFYFPRTYIFLSWFLCVISDMLCTRIFHAVAQTHIPHSLHCSNLCRACFPLHIFQYDSMIREAGLASYTTERYGRYDPNTRPTLFFTMPVNICPPRPPMDQLGAHRFLESRSLVRKKTTAVRTR